MRVRHYARLLVVVLLASAVSAQEFPWLTGKKPRPVSFPEIFVPSSEATLARLTALKILDLRPAEAFRVGHLPGARLVPHGLGCSDTPSLDCLTAGRNTLGLSGAEAVLLVSEGGRPAEVADAFWRLSWLGFARVQVLAGGVAAWSEAGLPLAVEQTAPPDSTSRESRPEVLADSVVVGAEWVRERFGLDGTEVIDLRGEAVWDGRAGTSGGVRRPGHIPHALPFDFRSLLITDGSMPDVAEARRTFGRLGPRPRTYVDLDRTFVIYGDDASDRRLPLAYLLLRAMGVDARIYLAGMHDWAADPGRPVVRVIDESELSGLLERENPGLSEDRPPLRFTLLDVRGEPDFAAGHLPGARNLPAQFCRDGLSALAAEGGGERASRKPVVIYCYGITCIRSRECLSSAGRAGFAELLWFRDGLPAWQAAGLPLSKSPEGASSLPPPR